MLDDVKSRKSDKRTGFAQNGRLTVGDGANPVKCQVEFGETSQFSVQIDLDQSTVPAGQTVMAQAVVSYGANGASVVRAFDVVSGGSISGVADNMVVSVVDQSPAPATPPGKYGVIISIGRSPRPTTAVPPIQSAFSGPIAGGATHSVPIPNGANSVAVFGRASAGLTVQQIARGLGPGGPIVVMDTDATIGQYLPLVRGAATVQISNTSGSSSPVTICFGIDG